MEQQEHGEKEGDQQHEDEQEQTQAGEQELEKVATSAPRLRMSTSRLWQPRGRHRLPPKLPRQPPSPPRQLQKPPWLPLAPRSRPPTRARSKLPSRRRQGATELLSRAQLPLDACVQRWRSRSRALQLHLVGMRC